MTDWRLSHGAFSFRNYRVTQNGKTWIARKSRPTSFPKHLGTFETHQEAMAACIADYRGIAEEAQT
jgi:hypothetical protein